MQPSELVVQYRYPNCKDHVTRITRKPPIMHHAFISNAHFHFPPQSMAPGQNQLSPTAVITSSMSLPLPALLASSSSVTILTKQPNPHRNASSSYTSSSAPSSASRYHQSPLTMSSSIPYFSTGVDRKLNAHHSTVFKSPTGARALVSPQGPNADDGALDNVPPESYTLSPTMSSPLERALDQTPSLTAFLEGLEREQLQEIHAKGGFAGFTAQEIEGWVAADRV